MRSNQAYYDRRHERLQLFKQRWFTRSAWCRRLIGWAHRLGGHVMFNLAVENFRQVGEPAVRDREITNSGILLMRRCYMALIVAGYHEIVDARDPHILRDVVAFTEKNKLQ